MLLFIFVYVDFDQFFIFYIDVFSNGLGVVLYQRQNGEKRVIVYVSRGLRNSERYYLVYKLEFFVLKWVVIDKFYDYFYGNKFDVVIDNNLFIYVLIIVKFDVIGYCWLVVFSNFQFLIFYRKGINNVDVDGLFR